MGEADLTIGPRNEVLQIPSLSCYCDDSSIRVTTLLGYLILA